MAKTIVNEPFFPNYNDSILNLSCSILKYYGIKPSHQTLAHVDSILERGHKHVVLILLDGLGSVILEHTLSYRDFLRRHLLTNYTSVFPPTTTAATTSLLSGKSPIEHGWLGWELYFEKEDKTVACFRNTLQGTKEQAAEYNVAQKYLPYESIIDQINQKGEAKAYKIMPTKDAANSDLYEWTSEIRKTIASEEKTFTYAYWQNPDFMLHKLGARSKDTAKVIKELNAVITDLCVNAKDTVFFITADHGHTAIQNDFIEEDYPEIATMLKRPASLEPRAISFYVKDEFKADFPKEFNKYFGNDYLLFTKEEALEKQLFGDGEPNANLTGIGEFIAAAVSSRTLLWNKKQKQFRSRHAGLTKDEMRIPLIWYETKPRRAGWIAYYTVVALFVAFLMYVILH